MPKPQDIPQAAEPIDMTLDEFCARTSNTDKRVELLGAFHAVERAAGRIKGFEADFEARYAAFANQPA